VLVLMVELALELCCIERWQIRFEGRFDRLYRDLTCIQALCPKSHEAVNLIQLYVPKACWIAHPSL
jgi:hypothetical protein